MSLDLAVSPQIPGLGESAHTDSALVWLLAGMPPDVYLECAAAHERLGTELALERTLTRMPPRVVSKVPVRRKLATAAWMLTYERLFPVMNTHMRLKIALLGEFLSTPCNLASKRLDSDLHERSLPKSIQ
jgi:hypothetical protein